LGRVSYTQFEARYAEQQGKRVLYIVLPSTFPFTSCAPEDPERVELQKSFRESIEAGGDQRGTADNLDALRALIRMALELF
jgi:hypothetical protein